MPKKVLMLAYDFPPGGSIGGGLRSLKFSRYLHEFGWQPKIVSVPSDKPEQVDLAIQRIASWTPWQWPYEMRPYGWAMAVANKLKPLSQDIDLIYVSCPPFPAALLTALKRLPQPIVVDFRDAWSLDPYQEGSRLKRLLYKHIFPGWEQRMLSGTDLLICNTPSMLSAYQSLYPQHAERMIYLPNGYDENDFMELTPSSKPLQNCPLRLLYMGRFGIGGRDPKNLLAGFKLAKQQGLALELEILGKQPKGVFNTLEKGIKISPEVPHQEAIKRMMQADALVLIQATSDASVQAVAGKTFEYLRSEKPILCIAPPGDNRDLIKQHAVYSLFPDDHPEAIAQAMHSLAQNWQKQDKQTVASSLPSLERRNLTHELARQFDRLVVTKT